MQEVVPEAGIMGKLHSGLGNPTRMNQRSMLAALNRLPQVALGSRHHLPAVELQEQWFRRSASLQGSPALGREGCPRRWECCKGMCSWPARGLGRRVLATVNTRREHGSLSSRWHAHCLCLLCKIPAVLFFCGFCFGIFY